MAEMESTAQGEIFAGYVLAPGYIWTGHYWIWLLDDFESINLHRNAVIRSPKLLRPHRVRSVEIPVGPVTFRLKSLYETYNAEIPGQSFADGENLASGIMDKWNTIGTWWIRRQKQPRRYRYIPC